MSAARRGFASWGFVLGNVLIAFGAPVLVTSLVAVVGAARGGLPAGRADVAAIGVGAVILVAGLVCAVTAGRARPVSDPPATGPARAAGGPARHPAASIRPPSASAVYAGFARADEPFAGFGTGPVADDFPLLNPAPEPIDNIDPTAHPAVYPAVPRPRYPGSHRHPGHNSRGYGADHGLPDRPSEGATRYCGPSVTGTRSTGSRRRPQVG